MSESTHQGPKLVWTFPLLTRFQSSNGVLGGGMGPIRRRINQNTSNTSSTDSSDTESSDETDEDDDAFSGIENSISDLEQSSEEVFDTTKDTVTVRITEDGFEPEEASIDVGDEVEWVNETDKSVKITSVGEGNLRTGIIDPDESRSDTIYSTKTVKYKDTTGNIPREGAILVGETSTRPDINPVPLSSDSNSGIKSMSQAAEDKSIVDRGF